MTLIVGNQGSVSRKCRRFSISWNLPGWRFQGTTTRLRIGGLDAFYVDVHEVTVRQFKRFVQQTGGEAVGATTIGLTTSDLSWI